MAVACLLGNASPTWAVDVVRISSPFLAIDVNRGLTGAYVGFRLVNSDPVAYQDLWVTIADFEGGIVGLAPFGSDRYRVGALAQGETKAAYFYLSASGETNVGQTHNVRLHEGSPQAPPFSNHAFSYTVVDSLPAQSNEVQFLEIEPKQLQVGHPFSMTVAGTAGLTGLGQVEAVWSPAARPDWRADLFGLNGVTISFGIDDCNEQTLEDLLYWEPADGGAFCYEAVYVFTPERSVSDPTPVSPVFFGTSGGFLKHNDLDDSCAVAVCVLPPVACDLLCDGFESGDFTHWSFTQDGPP